MKVLLLCGYFEPAYYEEIESKTKTWVENAANTFQERLISGLSEQPFDLDIVSAPFIGAWPQAYKDLWFRHFADEKEGLVNYVPFCNIWGIRNISREISLRKEVKKFMTSDDDQKVIIVYSPHTPFLAAAAYAKKIDPEVKVCFVVPDLPQYMNLSKNAHPVYDFFKKLDIRKLMRLNDCADSYILLTEQMASVMEVGNRPYFVLEGITDDNALGDGHGNPDHILYAGKLNESFGVRKLVDAFCMVECKDAVLDICGGGELKDYIIEKSRNDNRIVYHGLVSSDEASKLICDSGILVNPRQNDDEYTKYSFPSKNIEYLMSGNRVVAYYLDGMPEIYKTFIISPENDTTEALADTLNQLIEQKDEGKSTRAYEASRYIMKNLNYRNVGLKMYNLFKNMFERPTNEKEQETCR